MSCSLAKTAERNSKSSALIRWRLNSRRKSKRIGANKMRVGIIISHVRPEEKLLISPFQARGIEPDIISDREINLEITAGPEQIAPGGGHWNSYDVIMERSVRTSRGLYMLGILA